MTTNSIDESAAAFSTLALSPALLAAIESLNYQAMTPIQAQALPAVLDGRDLLAQAKTGSGKTLVFALGILHKLQINHYHTQALVLCPTRELAEQVSNEIRRLGRAIPNIKTTVLCGGRPLGPQTASLEHAPHIVVGTPGRILKHLDSGSLKLDDVATCVLDEADRMLDMGFAEDILRIIDMTPREKQTLLFSATFPHDISRLRDKLQNNPLDVRVESLHDDKLIQQIFYQVQTDERTAALISLLQHHRPQSCVVFCNRKQQCQDVADELVQRGFKTRALHGDLEQKERDQILVQFNNKSCTLLIATDVAARGLDIKELHAVINYELTPDPSVHVHRIGRTGRAGSHGLALSLFSVSEAPKLTAIETVQNGPVSIKEIPAPNSKTAYDLQPPMVTLSINAGRKDKIRAGDILGALTANAALSGDQIGKIDLYDKLAYVAVARPIARQALNILATGKIKGRKCRVQMLG